jgi:hypothetical protein
MINKISWFGHRARNGKKQNRVFNPSGNSQVDVWQATNSKDENRAFELCLRPLLSDMGFLQEHPTVLCKWQRRNNQRIQRDTLKQNNL